MLKHKLKEDTEPKVSGSLLDVCYSRAATCKASLVLSAAEKSVQQLSLRIMITNIFDDWIRNVLFLQNYNNFAGCWDCRFLLRERLYVNHSWYNVKKPGQKETEHILKIMQSDGEVKMSSRCRLRGHSGLTLLSFETEDPRSNPTWAF